MQKKKKIYTEAYVSYYIDLQVATSHLHTGTSFYRLPVHIDRIRYLFIDT